MKKKHLTTLQQIFARPVSGNIRWADIEALFVELGAEVSERAGSRIAVVLFGEVRVFIARTLHPRRTRARLQVYASGWKATE